ncbi:MAG: hypothetical protein II471_01550, partial [Bacteroidales bacterium]|nr:hypothetical protein [Bacteroidales bacterium]
AIESEYFYAQESSTKTDAQIIGYNDFWYTFVSGGGIVSNITNCKWSSTYPYLYKFKRTVYENGNSAISEIELLATYGQGNQSTVLETQEWWYAETIDATSYASTINNNWFDSDAKAQHGLHYFDCSWGEESTEQGYNLNYLHTLTRTVYGNGTSAVTNVNLEAIYGTSYPQFGDNPWSSTMPSISANKGKYLWTRTSYDSGTTWSYSVNYIGNDGLPGQDGTDGSDGSDGADGKGIASITTYYYASSSDNVSNIPAVGNSAWKTQPSSLTNPFSVTNKYLWSYTKTSYTVGNDTTTTRAIIGVWGATGSPGSGKGVNSIKQQYALTSSQTAPAENSNLWKDTPDEYPSSTMGLPKDASGSTQEVDNDNRKTVLANLSLKNGYTYTIRLTLDQTYSHGVNINLYNSGGTVLATVSVEAGQASASTTYTPNSDLTGCYVSIYAYRHEVGFSVSVEIPRYYYYQRDEISWTDGTTTHTAGVPSEGYNKAIYEINRLNPCFAEVTLNGMNKVVMDAGHIYADSLTAYSVTAYEAFIKNLMANYVQVDGNVDVTNGDITVTQAETTSQQMTQTYLDSFCRTNYSGKNFSQLSAFIQAFAYMRAVTSYLADQAQAAANAGKMVVTTANGYKKAALYQHSLISAHSTSGSTSYSAYGKDAIIGGNVQVKGNIAA